MPGLSDAATVAELNRSWQSLVEVGAPEKAKKVLETALVVIAGADFDASERRKQLVTTLHNLASWYAAQGCSKQLVAPCRFCRSTSQADLQSAAAYLKKAVDLESVTCRLAAPSSQSPSYRKPESLRSMQAYLQGPVHAGT